jgi:uncharacterized protein with PIN domain
MKFIADVMLGRLAKRMRLRGFDVLYDQTLDDNGIIRRSLEEHRVILTRDAALSKRPLAANNIFITSDDVREQMLQILAAFPGGTPPLPLTRCSVCNEPLIAISREEAQDLVPAYVHHMRDAFLRCSRCERVYWTGTHVQKMEWGSREEEAGKTGKRNR